MSAGTFCLIGLSVLCIWIGGSATAWAQPSGFLSPMFDCVIEPRHKIELGSSEEGIISQINVDRGDVVKKGEVVAELESSLQRLAVEHARLRAESDVEIRSSQARLDFRQTELARANQLHSKNILPEKTRDEVLIEQQLAALALESAKLEHRMAQVELKQAKAQLERRRIRSPVDGVVVELTMSFGEYAFEQTPLMTIATIDPLSVEVFVPVSEFKGVAVGMDAEVWMEAPIDGTYRAVVTVVDRVFDSASRTFGVRLELPNPNFKLPAGLNCRVRFVSDNDAAAPAGSDRTDLGALGKSPSYAPDG